MERSENLSLRLFYQTDAEAVQVVIQDQIVYLGPLHEEAIQEALRRAVIRRLRQLIKEA
ncbi:MAG: hypothetical protein GTO55_06985 [Armatimonadetes bacterium]|nr:hypothetical protein [Armatimonadota bacterium]NIM24019.1 hypothetical protein [Armatimonadota bacterium]NIM67869.1 hypothetical protein [Armatimonadota bacterium]NIN06099.1 hypothetical protein [Armatimonadota bacterium]NIO97494.1 hypothetical protein [Armatimonadota bacterium]